MRDDEIVKTIKSILPWQASSSAVTCQVECKETEYTESGKRPIQSVVITVGDDAYDAILGELREHGLRSREDERNSGGACCIKIPLTAVDRQAIKNLFENPVEAGVAGSIPGGR